MERYNSAFCTQGPQGFPGSNGLVGLPGAKGEKVSIFEPLKRQDKTSEKNKVL